MQDFIILATTRTENHTLVFYLTLNSDSQWSMKCRSRVPVQGACLKSMSRFHNPSYHRY